jgi:hypothetical protein
MTLVCHVSHIEIQPRLVFSPAVNRIKWVLELQIWATDLISKLRSVDLSEHEDHIVQPKDSWLTAPRCYQIVISIVPNFLCLQGPPGELRADDWAKQPRLREKGCTLCDQLLLVGLRSLVSFENCNACQHMSNAYLTGGRAIDGSAYHWWLPSAA